MFYYEVNLKIKPEIYEAYMRWLKPHVDEMLKFDGFVSAAILKELKNGDPHHKYVTVVYRIKHIRMLEDYLQHHAAQMREESAKRWGDGLTTNRRIFESDIRHHSGINKNPIKPIG